MRQPCANAANTFHDDAVARTRAGACDFAFSSAHSSRYLAQRLDGPRDLPARLSRNATSLPGVVLHNKRLAPDSRSIVWMDANSRLVTVAANANAATCRRTSCTNIYFFTLIKSPKFSTFFTSVEVVSIVSCLSVSTIHARHLPLGTSWSPACILNSIVLQAGCHRYPAGSDSCARASRADTPVVLACYIPK